MAALATILGCLSHCRPNSAAPQLQLCLRVILPQGIKLPELEAFCLQHLLEDLGLLPHRIKSIELGAPCFTLDGGLEHSLRTAQLIAEHHLLEGLASSAAYAQLRNLALDFGSQPALETFAELVRQGQFAGVLHLRLARQYAADPPPQPWDALELSRRSALLGGLGGARHSGSQRCSDGGSSDEEQAPDPQDWFQLMPGRSQLQQLQLRQPYVRCQLCCQHHSVCQCQEVYQQLAAEHDPCYDGSDLSFLQALSQVTALELANFAFTTGNSARKLPALPQLQSLAVTYDAWFAALPAFCQPNTDGLLLARLAERVPNLQKLQLDYAADDVGITRLTGLTSLLLRQRCGLPHQYHGFSWETCRLRHLVELQLLGCYGWMDSDADWRCLLQPKSFVFSGLGQLQRLVFDVSGVHCWPDSAGLEMFLAAVLDCFLNSNDSLQSLTAVHAILEDGPYNPAKYDGYLAEEGPLGTWGALRDSYGEHWVAMLCKDRTPKVIIMHQLGSCASSSGSDSSDAWSSSDEDAHL
ncbi:hypothetical protein N2152v2_005979 [Parachlorella kessleri]